MRGTAAWALVVFATACSPSGTGAGGSTSTATTTGTTATTGSGCPTAKQCGSSCCNATSTCIDDGTGNKLCEALCTLSSQCPPAKQCCSVIQGLAGQGVCLGVGAFNGQQCRCGGTADCTSGCCAPIANASGDPTGPYVCKTADGAAYDCPNGGACAAGFCPLNFTGQGNQVCAKPCTTSAVCTPGTCTVLMGGTCNNLGGACLPPAGA